MKIPFDVRSVKELPKEVKLTFWRLAAGLVIFIISRLSFMNSYAAFILGTAAFAVCGINVIINAVKNVSQGEIFSENVLMSVSGIVAVVIGNISEAVFIMLLFEAGEILQDIAVDNSRQSVKALLALRPDTVTLIKNGEMSEFPAEDVKKGDIYAVPPGGRIPVDGEIINGDSTIDTAPMTGEPLPRDCRPGDKVISGCINLSGTLFIRADVDCGDSAVSHILRIVEEAETRQGKTEKFITRFCTYYTPVIFALALIVGGIVPWVGGLDMREWIHRALVLLVAACPCALIISVPLAYFAGIGGAAKDGILFKNANALDDTARLTSVVFDKTGTLTTGSFEVVNTAPVRLSEEELMYLAVCAEGFSTHPIAKSICRYYGKQIDSEKIKLHSEVKGRGTSAKLVSGEEIRAGNAEFMEEIGAKYVPAPEGVTAVYVAVGSTYVGRIDLSDTVKETSAEAVRSLKEAGIANVAMMTGDNSLSAMRVGREVGITEVYADCLPQDKFDRLDYLLKLQQADERLAFVGDGINDVPVLTAADIGMAMGALGSEAAIEAADVVIMTDEPVKTAEAVKIARKVKQIVKINVAAALAVKVLVMTLGVCGIAPVWLAVLADSGLALVSVANAVRAIKV